LNSGPDSRADAATSARVQSNSDSASRIAIGQGLKAGKINVDAAPHTAVRVNLPAGMMDSLAPKARPIDPSAFQAKLDDHVTDVKRREDQRKAEEAAARARLYAQEKAKREADEKWWADYEAEKEAEHVARYAATHPQPRHTDISSRTSTRSDAMGSSNSSNATNGLKPGPYNTRAAPGDH
jgi:hypothetical protein